MKKLFKLVFLCIFIFLVIDFFSSSDSANETNYNSPNKPNDNDVLTLDNNTESENPLTEEDPPQDTSNYIPDNFNRYVVPGLEMYLPSSWSSVELNTYYDTIDNLSLSNASKVFSSQYHKFNISYGNGFYEIKSELEIKKLDTPIDYEYYLQDKYPLEYYDVDYTDFNELQVPNADKAYHARFYTDSLRDIATDAIVLFKNDLVFKFDIRHGITAIKDDLENERRIISSFRNDMDIILTSFNFIYDNISSTEISWIEYDFIKIGE